MAKILIAYASMSGNTEDIANLLKSKVEPYHDAIEMLEIEHMDAKDLADYDGLLIGSYTWGDGELPYEVEDFFEELANVDLSGKKAAVFGSGDKVYPKFCAAVDLIEQSLKECGAELVQNGLRIEFTPDTKEEKEQCEQFALSFAKALGNKSDE
ncbi:flavodoxin [Paenibacillus turpanensis]|uniref:flavodoxin n=1 Tax=Paenibacillus turpanensis TaxID=2689078 RepID=UPI00140B5A9F|nr:flavodoxin [Paenibacillus turpanensis]